MNKYELALVLSPALDEEGRAAEVAKVQATLERFGAKIEKVDDWGKRKLAYEIAKVNEGFSGGEKKKNEIRSTRCCTRRNRSSYAYYGKRSALPDHP